MTMSPTQLTLRHLREQGYVAEVTEHWNSHASIRQDLFGFVDVLAIKPGETLAVQTTSVTNVSARIKKIAESPYIGAARDAGWTIRVHGWSKVGNRWVLKRDQDVS
jgi:carbonic anhydrase